MTGWARLRALFSPPSKWNELKTNIGTFRYVVVGLVMSDYSAMTSFGGSRMKGGGQVSTMPGVCRFIQTCSRRSPIRFGNHGLSVPYLWHSLPTLWSFHAQPASWYHNRWLKKQKSH